MNIKQSFKSDWQALRSRHAVYFESPTAHAAHCAWALREGRMSRRIEKTMNRPLPADRLLAGYWVNIRCASYAMSAMRRAS